MTPERVNVAVIGAGHWGPNLIRLLLGDPRCIVRWICEGSEERRQAIARRYPVEVTGDVQHIFQDPAIDAVLIATPAGTHFDLAMRSLQSGKHTFVEKPLTTRASDSEELCRLAQSRQRVLAVGHVFLYNQAFRYLADYVQRPEFGKIIYGYARRLNLGPVRSDVHAAWDLAAHDIAMFLDLRGGTLPEKVSASSQSIIRPEIADVVFATLFYADGTRDHLHASWLDPEKTRELVVVGEQQMIRFDDMELRTPIRIYEKSFRRIDDHGTNTPIIDSLGLFRVELRSGNISLPSVSTGEPLANEIDDFISAVQQGHQVRSDGACGLRVVQILEAIDRSLSEGSRQIPVAAS